MFSFFCRGPVHHHRWLVWLFSSAPASPRFLRGEKFSSRLGAWHKCVESLRFLTAHPPLVMALDDTLAVSEPFSGQPVTTTLAEVVRNAGVSEDIFRPRSKLWIVPGRSKAGHLHDSSPVVGEVVREKRFAFVGCKPSGGCRVHLE